MLDTGGISGSLGSSNNIERFQLDNLVKPLICYESVYGDISNGITDLIAYNYIMMDGGVILWDRQHLNYSRLLKLLLSKEKYYQMRELQILVYLQ